MLWHDTILFKNMAMKLLLSSQDGTSFYLEVNPGMTVDQLKIAAAMASGQTIVQATKNSLYLRMVRVGNGQVLPDDAKLKDLELTDNDEILMMQKRIPVPVMEKQTDSRRTDHISTAMIMEATRSTPSINFDKDLPASPSSASFHGELRKILISLIEAAQRLLCLNPDAAKIFDGAQKLLAKDSSKEETTVSPQNLKQLTDMGFPEVRATKALIINNNSTRDSIQWLIEHEGDADIDEPLPEMERRPETAQAAESSASHQSDSSSWGEDHEMAEITRSAGTQSVMQMLNTFKSLRRRDFHPNRRALRVLVEMGFEEKECIEALRLHNNRQDQACEWLLSAESRRRELTEGEEVGLDPNSHVYKAIMTNPTVQLGLNNPRSLVAFLHLLENPANTQQWLNDPDTGPMLIQISRIYHAEKHVDEAASDPPAAAASASNLPSSKSF